MKRKKTSNRKIRAYFDGCCEPVNPGGTAAYGAVIYDGNDRVWEQSQIFKPVKGRERETSNNVAEYHGFIAILKELKSRGWQDRDIEVFGDSMLVICQMFGDRKRGGMKWRIKQGFYVKHAHMAKSLLNDFSRIDGRWIPREENSLADELSKAHLHKEGIEFRIQPE